LLRFTTRSELAELRELALREHERRLGPAEDVASRRILLRGRLRQRFGLMSWLPSLDPARGAVQVPLECLAHREWGPLAGVVVAFRGVGPCSCVTDALSRSGIIRGGREAILAEARRLHDERESVVQDAATAPAARKAQRDARQEMPTTGFPAELEPESPDVAPASPVRAVAGHGRPRVLNAGEAPTQSRRGPAALTGREWLSKRSRARESEASKIFGRVF
jgi:hypothetical protein